MIEKHLPTPPAQHHYEIERVSPLVAKVWLVRDERSQLLEKEIRTIYCFIKGKRVLRVHKPKNHKDMYSKSLCSAEELKDKSPWSLFVPKVTRLFD